MLDFGCDGRRGWRQGSKPVAAQRALNLPPLVQLGDPVLPSDDQQIQPLPIHSQAFVPVTLDEPATGPAPHAESDIRVVVQRANAIIVVIVAAAGRRRLRSLAARVVAIIRINAV